jgi:uncharacterized membrane protein YbhN (UPF0104 family)
VSGFVARRVERFAGGLSALGSSAPALTATIVTVGYWAATLGSTQIWLWAFDLSLPWYAPLVITSFLAFGTFLPSSPGFVGTYHYFAAASLRVFGVAEPTAIAFGVVGHAMAIVPFTVLGVPFLAGDLLNTRPATVGPRDRQTEPFKGSPP